MFARMLCVVTLGLSVSGCAAIAFTGAAIFSAGVDTIEQYEMKARFIPGTASHVLGYGSGQIAGRIWLQSPSGNTAIGSGANVQLVPATEYSIEYIQALFGNSKASVLNVSIANLDPRLFQYIRHTTADPDGVYSFTNVVHGNYFVMTFIKWKGRKDTHDTGQTRLVNKATVGFHERVTVDLNGQ